MIFVLDSFNINDMCLELRVEENENVFSVNLFEYGRRIKRLTYPNKQKAQIAFKRECRKGVK